MISDCQCDLISYVNLCDDDFPIYLYHPGHDVITVEDFSCDQLHCFSVSKSIHQCLSTTAQVKIFYKAWVKSDKRHK